MFSVGFSAALRNIQVAGAKADLSRLPAGALVGTIWAFTLATTLRYCQVSTSVERQYDYLHTLEDCISQEFGKSGIYEREGRAYLEDYPAFSHWAWINYVYIFPLLAILVTISLVATEWLSLSSGWFYKTLDTLLALTIIVTFFLYRFVRPVRSFIAKRRDAAQSAQ